MEKKPNIAEPGNHNSNHRLADYNLLAELFMYPADEHYKQSVYTANAWLSRNLPEAAKVLQPFAHFTETAAIPAMQELFLRSFDIQAITTLDIGFVLFGEDYKRGKLLVHLNEEHRRAGNNCETELSDHLPNLLRLLPKVQDDTLRTEMATLLLLPAVEKMISEFYVEKIEKKDVVYKKHQKVLLDYSPNNRTVYQNCLKALWLVLQKDFGPELINEPIENSEPGYSDPNIPGAGDASTEPKDFSQHIETEMLTEK